LLGAGAGLINFTKVMARAWAPNVSSFVTGEEHVVAGGMLRS
jgi:hypothetical protein